jgi:hypothetical protein
VLAQMVPVEMVVNPAFLMEAVGAVEEAVVD